MRRGEQENYKRACGEQPCLLQYSFAGRNLAEEKFISTFVARDLILAQGLRLVTASISLIRDYASLLCFLFVLLQNLDEIHSMLWIFGTRCVSRTTSSEYSNFDFSILREGSQ